MIDYKKTAIKLIGLVAVCFIVLLGLYLGIQFWPFLIGIIVALLLEKPIEFLIKKTKCSRKFIGTLMVILTFIMLGVIVSLIVTALVNEAISLSGKIPDIFENLKMEYNATYKTISDFLDTTSVEISDAIYKFGLELLSKITSFATDMVNSVVKFIMFIPNIMIYIIITFLATLFLVTDRRTITRFMTEPLPNSFVKKITTAIANCFKSLGGYFKAVVILIAITFIELLIAFWIIGIDYPLSIALIVAVVDALPILGTGTVLLPWAIYSAITGDIGMGIALLVIYLVITVVRQLIEPKIVSENIGIHPFITLLCMYIGFKLIGLFGLVVGPVVLVIFKNVFNAMFETNYFKHLFVLKKEKKAINKVANK